MMDFRYYNFAMKDLDSMAVENIAKQVFGSDFRFYLGEDTRKKEVTLADLKTMSLRGQKVTIENCDKTAVHKPSFVTVLQPIERESYIQQPEYTIEIAAQGEVLQRAKANIEAVLQGN